jgi:hypothetical protein
MTDRNEEIRALYPGLTYQQISELYAISRQRVEQIVNKPSGDRITDIEQRVKALQRSAVDLDRRVTGLLNEIGDMRQGKAKGQIIDAKA